MYTSDAIGSLFGCDLEPNQILRNRLMMRSIWTSMRGEKKKSRGQPTSWFLIAQIDNWLFELRIGSKWRQSWGTPKQIQVQAAIENTYLDQPRAVLDQSSCGFVMRRPYSSCQAGEDDDEVQAHIRCLSISGLRDRERSCIDRVSLDLSRSLWSHPIEQIELRYLSR